MGALSRWAVRKPVWALIAWLVQTHGARVLPALETACARLEQVVEELGLSPAHWTFEVSPLPGIDESVGPAALDATRRDGNASLALSIRELGLVPGSTLHLRRLEGTDPRGSAGRPV